MDDRYQLHPSPGWSYELTKCRIQTILQRFKCTTLEDLPAQGRSWNSPLGQVSVLHVDQTHGWSPHPKSMTPVCLSGWTLSAQISFNTQALSNSNSILYLICCHILEDSIIHMLLLTYQWSRAEGQKRIFYHNSIEFHHDSIITIRDSSDSSSLHIDTLLLQILDGGLARREHGTTERDTEFNTKLSALGSPPPAFKPWMSQFKTMSWRTAAAIVLRHK